MKKKNRIPALILAVLLAAVLLTSCSGGAKQTEPQTEEETRASRKTKEASEAATTTAEPITTVPMTDAPTTAVPTTAESSTEAPTTEAVAETVPEGLKAYRYKGVVCWVPEGFVEKADSNPLTLISSGKLEGNNITFVAAKDKPSYYSEESLKSIIEKTYTSLYNTGIKDYSYESKKIEGGDLITACFSVDLSQFGMMMKQISCTVFLDERSVTITYTAVDDEYDKLFRTCAEHIYISADPPAPETSADAETTLADDKAPEGFKDYRFEGAVISIPKDFVEKDVSDAGQITLVHRSKESSTLTETITLQKTTGSISDFPEDQMKKQFETLYKVSLNAELTDWTYRTEKVPGGDRIFFGFSTESSGVSIRQNYSILLFDKKAVMVLCTEVNGMFEKEFRTVLESVRIDTDQH